MKPQDPPARTGITFEAVYRDAFAGHAAFKKTAEHALAIGIRPTDLLRYVRRELEGYEHAEMHCSLVRSPWATDRVVALVKAARTPGSLGERLLSSTHTDPYVWGMKNTGDSDLDMAHLLEQV